MSPSDIRLDKANTHGDPSSEDSLDEDILEGERREFEGDETDRALYDAIKSLLHAPPNDDEAAIRAVQQFRRFYHDTWRDTEVVYGWKSSADRGLGYLITIVCEVSWELAMGIPFQDYRYCRLADFFVGFKTLAAKEFDPRNPQLQFDSNAASHMVYQYWSQNSITARTQHAQNPWYSCERWISTSVYLAKLFGAGIVGADDMFRMVREFEDGLEGAKDDATATEMIRTCRRVVAVQYILVAGHVVVDEARHPTQFQNGQPLVTAARWNMWADKLEHIARIVPEDADWGLKGDAFAAHGKMLELYPEAFEAD